MDILLIRGLPGSGKSTMAKQFVAKGWVLCEADEYFYNSKGVYSFNPKELKHAHAACLLKARKALYHKQDVIVCNTFVKKCEMQPYYDLAEEFEATLSVAVKIENYGNIHGVPDWKMEQMATNWEE